MVSTARQARTGSVTLGTVLGGIALGIAAPLAMLFARNLTDQTPSVENYWLGPVILLMHLAIAPWCSGCACDGAASSSP